MVKCFFPYFFIAYIKLEGKTRIKNFGLGVRYSVTKFWLHAFICKFRREEGRRWGEWGSTTDFSGLPVCTTTIIMTSSQGCPQRCLKVIKCHTKASPMYSH